MSRLSLSPALRRYAHRAAPIAAAVAWTPATLGATLAGWWDFGDATTLFTDAGTTQVSADGQAIYQANDKSGNNRHAVQATLANRPTYKVNIRNGHSVARYDGADRLRTANFNFDLRARTVFAVFTESVSVGDAGVVTFWPASGNDYNQTTALVISAGTAPNALDIAGSTSTSYRLQVAGTKTAWRIVAERKGIGTPGRGYIGGGTPGTDASYTEFGTSPGGVELGHRTIAAGLNGDLAEVIVCDSELSPADANLLGAYLAAKWGLSWSTIS